jgi:hypothetical protein
VRTGDEDGRCHHLAVDRAARLSPWEGGAPLRRQLSWAVAPDAVLLHAAAVGDAAGAALLIGSSGAGKSSTALACLQAGMGFLSDDACLLRGDPPEVHRIHATARLFDEDIDHYIGLGAPAALGRTLAPEDPGSQANAAGMKALYLLHDAWGERMVTSAPVRVVLLPEPRGARLPQLERIRPTEALRRVAPDALWHMGIDPARELTALRRLLAAVPCYRLVLGRDRAANPALIGEALAAASGS